MPRRARIDAFASKAGAMAFMQDCSRRIGKSQITTDEHKPYLKAVEAGLTHHVWSITELVGPLDLASQKGGLNGLRGREFTHFRRVSYNEMGLTTVKPLYSVGNPMALDKELETYKQKLPELKEHEGKFALIHGETFVDVYTSYEDAIKAGYDKFGLEPFLVRQIHATEQAQFISRIVAPTIVMQST